MVKRIAQSLVIVSLLSTCLYFSPRQIDETIIQATNNDEEKILSNDIDIYADIIKNSKELVAMPIMYEEVEVEVEEETIEEVIVEEPIYFIDVVEGYITEDSIKSICEFVSYKYNDRISPKLLQAIALTESEYYVNATGTSDDKGLCQVVCMWHKERIDKLGITDIYNPYENILVCADIINELMSSKYGYDIQYVLMAYNMGPTRANELYESGIISKYAFNVLENAEKLGYSY